MIVLWCTHISGGEASHAAGAGVHARSKEQMSADGCKGTAELCLVLRANNNLVDVAVVL